MPITGISQGLAIGGGTSATISGAPGGAFSNALSCEFDGSDDYVDCGDSNDFSFGNGSSDTPFSVSFWGYLTDDSDYSEVVTKDEKVGDPPAHGREWSIFRIHDNDYGAAYRRKSVLFTCYDNSDGTYGISRCSSLDSWPINQWVHVAVTYDGTGVFSGMKIYTNGSDTTTTNASGLPYTAMHNFDSPLRIGTGYSSKYTAGKIDEVAIFNSELSAADVAAIYNGGAPASLESFDPVGWWRMGDGDTYDTLTDHGSGGNNGTMKNMTAGDIVASVP